VYDSARQPQGDTVLHSRRDIVKTLAALPLIRLNRAEPELVVYNGQVSTMNPGQPEATAIAIRDARFLAAGSDKDVLSLAGKHTRRIDLAGRRVFPGFNDAHAHPWLGGVAALKNVACHKNSIEEILNFHGDVLHFYGDERAGRMFAYRSFIDAGLRPPCSSDYTASPPAPMLWLYSETTRRDPTGHVWGEHQRISLAEALRSATLDGAYASFEEHEKGSIEPGKLADLVVLAQDPLALPPERWLDIKVERTMLGGKWVYEA
jgi:predicted amidohydrolase YtcJ